LDTFIKIYIKSHREQKVCIVGSLSPDLNTLSTSTKVELVRMTELILTWLTGILTAGREKKLFAFHEEPQNKATLIFSSLVASLQLSRVMDKLDYKGVCQAIIEDLKP